MLMTMMSNGGIGGGVASAIARAVGAGRVRDADALVGHTVLVATVFGALFTAVFMGGGPFLYAALGGRGRELIVYHQRPQLNALGASLDHITGSSRCSGYSSRVFHR